ncbi:MAG: fasciclin domain-containing protein [Ilumatobacteraceae bacterium]
MTPGRRFVIDCDRYRRAIAMVGLASIALAAGCSSARSIDDASAAAAAPAIASGEAPIVTSSIEPTAPPSLPTLYDVLAQDRFVALKVALERSGLDDILDGLDDFILLAPTDAAFASSGADIGIEYPTLMNDARLLDAILRYHIVGDASTNQSWRTLNGAALDVDGSDADTIERVDGVDVLDPIHLSNGTVYVTPRLLLPAPEPLVTGTVLQDEG